MEGNIVGEEFDEFVVDQIKVRQSNQFGGYNSTPRTPDQIQYLNNRNAWVKLASSVDILEKLGLEKLQNIKIEDKEGYLGTKLAEKAILFNSLSSFNPSTKSYSDPRANISNSTSLWNDGFAYGIGGTNFGIQPPPGIIGVNVDSLNRGSIRKANITLKAYNRFQFDIIEILYLRLGFTMMLEWGWDKFLNNEGNIQETGNTIIEEKWFISTNGISQLEMLGYIQDMRDTYQGNYDGFFGKVSNFTWNFNTDGSYDISIDLITVGDVIESLKVNTFSKQKFYSDSDNGVFGDENFISNSSLKDTNIAKASTLNSIGYFLYKKTEEISNSSTPALPGLKKLTNVNTENNPNDISTLYIQYTPSNTSIPHQYYVKFGEFLSQLENLIVPLIQNNDTTSPQISISSATSENYVSYFPNQISLDPRVCIFYPFINVYGDIKGINYPDVLTQLDPYITAKSTDEYYGQLMNIYINFEFISSLLINNTNPNQELSLYKFLQDICNGINEALGGVNKLEPIIKNDRVVTIIDQTLSLSPLKNNNIVNLEVYGYNPQNQTSNFVKDIKFISKITPQLASMISIGATAAGSSTSEIDGTAFSKWSEGLQDRFTQEILEPNGLSNIDVKKDQDISKYKTEFSKFPPTNGFIERTLTRIFSTSEWTKKKESGIFNQDIRKITDPYYDSIHNRKMDFDKFYSVAREIRRQNALKGEYSASEIGDLVGKNYAIYLVNAFGGKVENIKIGDEKFVDTGGTIVGGGKTYEKKFIYTPITISNPKYFEFNDTFISQGKGAYKNYINILNNTRYKETQTPSSEIGFIPLSFDITLDGISGIKIYNKLNINNEFLPSNYPNSLNFIITKVNHSITNNSWDTSLSTISIPKTEPYKFNTSPLVQSSSAPTVEYTPISEALTPIQEFKGQLLPLKNIIGAYESNGSYDIANIGGSAKISRTKVLNLPLSELKKFQSLPQGDINRVFAAGKYQVIPDTLNTIQQGLKLTLSDKFSIENQEKIADYLLLSVRKTQIGNYLAGNNSGNITDLEKAIQGLGQEFASMPVIFSSNQQRVGDVVAGTGRAGYYGGKGANPTIAKIGIKEIARILIQTRINYSGKPPIFIPIYYTS